MDVVDKILKLLQETNTEQKQLTAYLGVSPQTVSDWKSGKTKSYMKHLDRIAEYFNVSTDYLLGQKSEIDKQLDGVDFALLSETENLTMEQKEDVLKYIRFIKADSNKE